MTSIQAAGAPVSGEGLVLPREPVDETRAVTRAYARYLADCCQLFFRLDAELTESVRPTYARIAGLVRQALAEHQGAMLRCLASPTVSTPLRCSELRHDLDAFRTRIDAATTTMLPHLLLEMGLRGLIPAGQVVDWEHGAVSLASLALSGELRAPDGASGWRFSSTHLAATAGGSELGRLPIDPEAMHRGLADGGSDLRFERRYWRTGKVASFATVDHNPIAEFEAHPEKAGNHIDMGERSPQEWVAMLDECFGLVEAFLPGELTEMRTLLHQLVPVGYDPQKHLSASYREAVGTVYLTLHPNVMTMTEAVIHEFQHNKLNVSSFNADYLSNAFHPLYRSPVRPDPRPLWGILLAVHAFLPVAELYRRMRDARHPLAANPEFERRLSDIDLKNHEGMEMLRAHGHLTAAGRALFGELEDLEHRHLADRAARGLENTPTEIHVG